MKLSELSDTEVVLERRSKDGTAVYVTLLGGKRTGEVSRYAPNPHQEWLYIVRRAG